MWRRFKRMVQSNLGRLSDMGGGRGLTGDLEREARELERALQKAGEGLITVKGEVTFLEEKARKLARREEELAALEQAAIARGADAAAGGYTVELARVKTERATTDRQLAIAREALERGQIARSALQARREQKLAEAREREKIYQELEREDLGAGVHAGSEPLQAPGPRVDTAPTSPAADPPRKTVGGAPVAPVAEPAAVSARSAKTIGPEPGGDPAPAPSPSPPPAAPAALKIRVKAREGDATPALDHAVPEPGRPDGETGAFDATAASPPAGEAAPTDIVGELERLVRLREQGVLTEEELEQAKRRLLGSGAGV